MQSINIQNFQVHPSQGLNVTLQKMKHLENLSLFNPKFVKFVHDTFENKCISCIPGEVWNYMREVFTYKEDFPDEKITAPHVLVQTLEGDCDDFSLFSKTVLDVIGGFNTNYMLLGKQRNKFSHVITRAQIKTNSMFQRGEVFLIDGASPVFNSVNNKYIFRKII